MFIVTRIICFYFIIIAHLGKR